MNLSAAGLTFLKGNESCSLTPYPDPPGSQNMSVGWGHSRWTGGPISQETADWLLEQDLRFFVGCVNAHVDVPLTQPQFDALVDFVYNEGASSFLNSTLLKYLNAGNYGMAADHFLEWDKDVRQGALSDDPILEARRKAEKAMFLSELPEEPAA